MTQQMIKPAQAGFFMPAVWDARCIAIAAQCVVSGTSLAAICSCELPPARRYHALSDNLFGIHSTLRSNSYFSQTEYGASRDTYVVVSVAALVCGAFVGSHLQATAGWISGGIVLVAGMWALAQLFRARVVFKRVYRTR